MTRYILIALAVVFPCMLSSNALLWGQAIVPATQPSNPRIEALTLAERDYGRRYGAGRDAMEGTHADSFRIGYDVPDFAAAGQEIWEVRYIRRETGESPELRAVFWVNLSSGRVFFLTGRKEARAQPATRP